MWLVVMQDGSVYDSVPRSRFYRPLDLPEGVVANGGLRPYGVNYRGSVYLGGIWNRGLVYRGGKLRAAGINPPVLAPTVAASGTGLTTATICYLTFAEVDHSGATLQESRLSPPSVTLTLTNQGVAWTNLPTNAEQRVNKIRGYRSVAGSLPYLAWERDLRTTSVTENLASDSLIAGISAPVDEDGALDATARGVPPPALNAARFNDHLFYIRAGMSEWTFSRLFEPESVSLDPLLSTISVPDGEQPIAFAPRKGELLSLHADAVYSIKGFGATDFRVDKISSSQEDGILGPQCVLVLRDAVAWAGPEGIVYYDGGLPRNIMAKSRREAWKADYAANAADFLNGILRYNGRGQFVFMPARSGSTSGYTAAYRAMVEEGRLEPWWFDFQRTREDYTMALLGTSDRRTIRFAFGCADGHIREEDETDVDDDSDAYLKHITIQPGHRYGDDMAGDDNHGRTLTDIDLFMVNEETEVDVSAWGGDSHCADGVAPYTHTVEAGAKSNATKRGSVHLNPIDGCSGKGFSVRLEADSPDQNFEYHGLELLHIPGSNDRPTLT